MASVVARNQTQWTSTICDACRSHLVASRSSPPGHIRFFSAATRTAPLGSRTAVRDPAFTQSPGRRIPIKSVQWTPRRYESTQSASPASEPPFIARTPPRSGASFPAECARLTNRRLIALSGPDAAKFLQGLVTNNVDPAREEPFYAAFLDARGRMLWDVFVWSYPGLSEQQGLTGGEWACYIEVDADEVQSLVKHLKRHKLRSKITIKVVEEAENMQVLASWSSQDAIGEGFESIVTIEDPRFISDRMTMSRSLRRSTGASSSAQDNDHANLQEYIRMRHSYGIPEGQEEIPRESALPMEYNVDLSQGIDFKKGCYVGQELTIRTKHTGVVRKRILPVELSTPDSPPSVPDTSSQIPTYDADKLSLDPARFDSADIKQLAEDGTIKKGRAAGKLVSVCGNVGLALCRLEMMTSMKISAEGGSWKPGMEFGVADREGGVVRVRPFVRDEWVTRVRDIWDKKRTRI